MQIFYVLLCTALICSILTIFSFGNLFSISHITAKLESAMSTGLATRQVSFNSTSPPVITYGIASGDATNHSVIIWSKTNRNALMTVS